ncbi:hypothetical protein [Agathobaculum sp. Marseille-P7918]|uniref:hypothetical protein n=1 Tax=Agathobaculum sp. Marseille-P7918 TaxID=2479843 RepID=UPI0035615096
MEELLDSQVQQQNSNDTDLIKIADGILFDARANLRDKSVIRMPISQLSTLGAGVASLVPAFRTVTQTSVANVDGLYKLVNAGAGDVLKAAKNGNFWGAIKTAEGTSKMAQLQKAAVAPVSTTTTVAINPGTVMMAVALFSIEQKLDSIAETQRQILSFLEVEKESAIEADMETLSSMMLKYKSNWDNEHYIASNYKLALDIARSARKNMISYQKKVTETLHAKKRFVFQAKVTAILDGLLRDFQYYRLSLYIFSMASFIEVMLSGDFKEENILFAKDEIEKMAATYRDIFTQCSVYLEKLSDASLETNLLKGIGTASKAVGNVIGNIPIVKEGSVDEFLQDSGKQMKQNAVQIERKVVESFAAIGNPGVHVFSEKLNDMMQIYGHTSEIYFDKQDIYLVTQ